MPSDIPSAQRTIPDPVRRNRLMRAATYASLTVALMLAALKAWAWQTTGSVALLSSLADSILDVLASMFTFWAVRASLAPADSEHRFGHGKSEGLAALFQAFVVAGSALFVCYEAAQRLANPQPIRQPELGIAVLIGATAATFILVGFQRYVTRATGSVAITADALHYTSDVLMNLGVALAVLVAGWTGWLLTDPVVGLGIALYILVSAYRIVIQSLNILLDAEIPDVERERVKEIALRHPEVQGLHDMRTRHGGSHYIIQFHLDLPREMSLWRSHEILDEVEEQIRHAYPGCEIIIHADPLGIREMKDLFDGPVEEDRRRGFG